MKKTNLSDYNYCVTVGQTDVGRHRKANEDHGAHFLTQNGLVSVVCDGMGGHVGGAVASEIAVETIHQFLDTHYFDDPRQAISQAIDAANQAILARAASEPSLTGMGSTCVLLIVRDAKVYIGHVGDSRIYIVREKNITQLTKDHSFVQMLVDLGEITKEEAEHHPRKNEITNALGIPNMAPATVKSEPITPQAGDCFVLCSDGLSGMVSDHQIEKTVSKQRELRTQERANRLVEMANENGGVDNITVELVEFTITPVADAPRKFKAKHIGLVAGAVVVFAAIVCAALYLLFPKISIEVNADWGPVAFADGKPVFTLMSDPVDGTTLITLADPDAEPKAETIAHVITKQGQIETNLTIDKVGPGYTLSLPGVYPADSVYVSLTFGKKRYIYYAWLEHPAGEPTITELLPKMLEPVPYNKSTPKTIAELTYYPGAKRVVLSVVNNDPINLSDVVLDTDSVGATYAKVESDSTADKHVWAINRTKKEQVVLSFICYKGNSGQKYVYIIPYEKAKEEGRGSLFDGLRKDKTKPDPKSGEEAIKPGEEADPAEGESTPGAGEEEDANPDSQDGDEEGGGTENPEGEEDGGGGKPDNQDGDQPVNPGGQSGNKDGSILSA